MQNQRITKKLQKVQWKKQGKEEDHEKDGWEG